MSPALELIGRLDIAPDAGPGIGRRAEPRGWLSALRLRLGAAAARLPFGGRIAAVARLAQASAGPVTSLGVLLRRTASEAGPDSDPSRLFDRLRPVVEASLRELAEKSASAGLSPNIVASRAHFAEILVVDALQIVRQQAALRGCKAPLTVVALGRYGRHGLDRHDPVELLMLVPDGGRQRFAAETLARQLEEGLCSLGLPVAASVLGPLECLTFALDEPAVRTSLLDGRYIGGPYGPWAELQARLDAVTWGGDRSVRPR